MARLDRIVLIVWGVALALTALSLALAPLIAIPIFGPFFFPFFLIPPAFLYFTAILPIYLPIVLVLRDTSIWPRLAVAVVATALVFGIGLHVVDDANARTKADVAALLGSEKPAPITLAPVRTVALVDLESQFPPPINDCNDFCLALLLSGTAKDVVVAGAQTDGATPPPGLLGTRYTLAADRRDCVTDEKEWHDSFAGKRFADVSRTGGFGERFQARYIRCVTAQPDASLAADVIFVAAMPAPRHQAMFLGMDWSFEHLDIVSVQRTFVHGTERMKRMDILAYTLDKPLWMLPVSPGPSGGADPGRWSHTPYAERDPAPFLVGWWGFVGNDDEIYGKGVRQNFLPHRCGRGGPRSGGRGVWNGAVLAPLYKPPPSFSASPRLIPPPQRRERKKKS